MDYYQCRKVVLHQELARRGLSPYGEQDVAAERLRKDDEQRRSEATTISVTPVKLDRSQMWRENPEFGKTVPAVMLANERIVHWTMNTFFPALHLFFSSGLSCTIEGSFLSGAVVGLDPELRYRLTDITHEEGGRLVSSIVAKKFAGISSSVRILEATMARRTSIAVKQTQEVSKARPVTTIVPEEHFVVGLRLEGMKTMGYVWAKLPDATVRVADRMWSHVRIAGLTDEVPVPFVRFPRTDPKPGTEMKVVGKESMISPDLLREDFEDADGR